jgi:hypothetical protein
MAATEAVILVEVMAATEAVILVEVMAATEAAILEATAMEPMVVQAVVQAVV